MKTQWVLSILGSVALLRGILSLGQYLERASKSERRAAGAVRPRGTGRVGVVLGGVSAWFWGIFVSAC